MSSVHPCFTQLKQRPLPHQFVVLSILRFFILGWRKRDKDSSSTNKPTKTHRSSLPSDQCHHFSLAKIKAATNNFDEALIIGVGGFGKVYKGDMNIEGGANLVVATGGFLAESFLGKGSHDSVYKAVLDDGKLVVAIKKTKLLHPSTTTSFQSYHNNNNCTSPSENEIEILSRVHHPRLVNLVGLCADSNDTKLFVVEYMPNGTLYDLLHLPSDHHPSVGSTVSRKNPEKMQRRFMQPQKKNSLTQQAYLLHTKTARGFNSSSYGSCFPAPGNLVAPVLLAFLNLSANIFPRQGRRGKPSSTKPWLAKLGKEKRKAKGKKKLLNGPPNYQKVVF
jgi:hypothetical protein